MKPSILFFIFFAGLVLEARGSSNSEQEDEGDDLLRLTLDMNPDNNFDDIARELRKALASLQKSTKQKQPIVHKVDGECINDPCIAEADVRATITVYGKHFKSSYHVVLHSQKSDLLSIEDPDFIICEPINRSERHIHCQVHVLSATSQEYNIYLKTESEITYTGKQLKVSVNQYEASDLQNSEEIGGLSFELEELCSRVLSSRKIDSLYKNLGVKPIRGIILYGEPGTGKTLVARTLARSLKAIRTDVINGPSLMSKYVGDSESNVRAIFSKAEKDYKSEQQNASLHVLIIDEMDAVLRPRGGDDTNSARSSYDSVTTQFLALMDGYEYLPNILLIGLTNKISGIDHALLRPGRFELHLHIPIPTRQAREEIFNVHIRTLRAYNHVSRDLDVAVLAEQTLNFTGADIEGTVRAAVSHAILRDPFEVNYSDFILAIDEVRNNNKVIPPDFIQYGIIPFGNRFEEIIQTYDRLHSRLITSTIQNTVFVIEGRDGSGSTSLASFLGMKYNPASIRLVSTANMIGFSNKEQEELLSSIFEEAVNTSYSVIILDKIEEIISAITSSGAETRLVQRLNMLLKAPNTFVYPGAQARINLTVRSKLMLIITTRQLHKIQASGLHIGSNTHVKIQLDPLTITEQDTILQSWKYLSNEQLPVFASEARKYLGMKNIPIKYLLDVLEYSYALQCEEKLPSPRNNLFRNKAIENLNEEQCDFDVKYLYEVLSIFSSQLIQKIEHIDLEEI